MDNTLIRRIRTRSPLVLRTTPPLSRFHRIAFHHKPASSKANVFFYAPLQRLFCAWHSLGWPRQIGEFDYNRLGRTITIRFNAANLQFQALYSGVYPRGYEQENSLLIDLLLEEGATFYDIGSNWGYFTLYAASNHDRIVIHAFEPFPKSHSDLVSCVEQAGLSGIVTCHNLALSNRDGQAFVSLPDGLHSGLAKVTSRPTDTQITVKPLDAIPLSSPDFIKMDVEGHEKEVLTGGIKTLEASRPFIVFENIRDYSSPAKTLEPLYLLANLGYRLYIPAARQTLGGGDFFLPSGWQIEIHRMQLFEDLDFFALVPFDPSMRFLFQYDINVFACHESRLPQLQKIFSN